MKILTFTTLFPNSQQPNLGIFIKHRMSAVNKYCDAEVRVVAPVPYFPNLPINKKWQAFSQVPKLEIIDSLPVYHPCYLVTPKVGMTCYFLTLAWGAKGIVKKLHKEAPFDLIDAHFVYPDGLAAILLGKMLKIPVVLSARGTDINLYPQFRLINPLVKAAVRKADHLVSVCRSLQDMMLDLGGDPERAAIIPNGIDDSIFKRIPKSEARRVAGIDLDQRVMLVVGALIERKGIHILLESLTSLKKMGRLDFTTYVIGKGDYRPMLEQQIATSGLHDKVKLVGEVANENLRYWYNSANLFFLGSSREGWPNVVSEALACGVPVVATGANGTPEILKSSDYGLIVERNSEAFAEAIVEGFRKEWDYDKIYQYGQSRSWRQVASEVRDVFDLVLCRTKGRAAV
ncbi:MAG: glycosyltransferase [Desulfuromonadales bacterium]|nr:glycosyltransferase [Desulfuromonadales bacterium]